MAGEAFARESQDAGREARAKVGALGRLLCGGLDRHIEHHLYPNLPPYRLHALSGRIRRAGEAHGVRY